MSLPCYAKLAKDEILSHYIDLLLTFLVPMEPYPQTMDLIPSYIVEPNALVSIFLSQDR